MKKEMNHYKKFSSISLRTRKRNSNGIASADYDNTKLLPQENPKLTFHRHIHMTHRYILKPSLQQSMEQFYDTSHSRRASEHMMDQIHSRTAGKVDHWRSHGDVLRIEQTKSMHRLTRSFQTHILHCYTMDLYHERTARTDRNVGNLRLLCMLNLKQRRQTTIPTTTQLKTFAFDSLEKRKIEYNTAIES